MLNLTPVYQILHYLCIFLSSSTRVYLIAHFECFENCWSKKKMCLNMAVTVDKNQQQVVHVCQLLKSSHRWRALSLRSPINKKLSVHVEIKLIHFSTLILVFIISSYIYPTTSSSFGFKLSKLSQIIIQFE